jgi:LysM repeat protein
MRRLLLFGLAAAFLATAPRAQDVGGDLYVVQAGDTLYRIARAHNMTVDRLRRLNEVVDDYISVGQALRLTDRVPLPPRGVAPPAGARPGTPTVAIPNRPTPDRPAPPTARPPAPPAGAATHVVATGETLFRIAQRYGMPVGELRRLNVIQGDAIQVGQRLTVVPAPGAAPPISGGVATSRPTPDRSTATAPVRAEPIRLTPPRAWSTTDTTVPADLAHFVEPGETLYSIAASYGFPLDALVAGNALSTAPLEPGTILYLPAPVDPAWAAARTLPDVAETGLALVYPDVLAGRPTASGEAYDPLALTASHRDLPLGTVLLVTNPASGRSTFVRVADRGPVSRAYLVELSAAAATALDLDPNAARRVELRLLP